MFTLYTRGIGIEVDAGMKSKLGCRCLGACFVTRRSLSHTLTNKCKEFNKNYIIKDK